MVTPGEGGCGLALSVLRDFARRRGDVFHLGRRFHLRADGAAVLLVDATDAIHLNPTAALLAGLALEGVPAGRAAVALRRRFRGVDPAEARAAADKVYALVEPIDDRRRFMPHVLRRSPLRFSNRVSRRSACRFPPPTRPTWR